MEPSVFVQGMTANGKPVANQAALDALVLAGIPIQMPQASGTNSGKPAKRTRSTSEPFQEVTREQAIARTVENNKLRTACTETWATIGSEWEAKVVKFYDNQSRSVTQVEVNGIVKSVPTHESHPPAGGTFTLYVDSSDFADSGKVWKTKV